LVSGDPDIGWRSYSLCFLLCGRLGCRDSNFRILLQSGRRRIPDVSAVLLLDIQRGKGGSVRGRRDKIPGIAKMKSRPVIKDVRGRRSAGHFGPVEVEERLQFLFISKVGNVGVLEFRLLRCRSGLDRIRGIILVLGQMDSVQGLDILGIGLDSLHLARHGSGDGLLRIKAQPCGQKICPDPGKVLLQAHRSKNPADPLAGELRGP